MASQLGIRAGRAFVELTANDTKLVRGLRSAQRKLRQFGARITAVGKQMALAGGMMAAPLALSLRIGANFEDQMSKVKAVTSGTADEFDVLNRKAKELGRTTSFTATQVAEGMVGLGRAGFSRKEIDQSIDGLLNLARATDTEMAEATDIAAASLRQFNLEASEMDRVVDVLTATANGSAQILTDVGESLKFVAPLASEAGETIEQTAAALGVMANNGIKGSMAGTSLSRAYKNLASNNTQKLMNAIGVSVADASGNMRPMIDILKDISTATEGLGNKQRLAVFEELFGRGLAANIKLAQSGLKFDDMFDAIQNSGGLAAKTAKEMDNNLGGSFRMFMSAAEGVAIAVKDAIEMPVRKALKAITTFLGTMAEWIEQNQGAVKAVAAVAVSLLVAGGALLAVGAAAGVVSFAIGGLATIASGTAAVFAFLATPMFGVIAAITGIVAGLGLMVAWLVKSWDSIKNLGGIIKSVFGLFAQWMKSGIFATAGKLLFASLKVVWLEGITDLNKTFDKLKDSWSEVIDEFVSGWKEAVGEVNNETKKLSIPDPKGGVVPKSQQNPVGKDTSIGGFFNFLGRGISAPFKPTPEKASEGVIEVFSLTAKDLKNELKATQKSQDDIPIMPMFAQEEDPEIAAAKEKFDELTEKLAGLNVQSPKSLSEPLRTGGGSALRNVISFINRSTENKTLDELKQHSIFLADLVDRLDNSLIIAKEAR